MKQHYVVTSVHWLTIVWLLGVVVSARAQSVPVVQWQRVIESESYTPTSSLRAVKTEHGKYGVLTGKNLTSLSATGDVIWTKPLPGSYADSSTSRVSIKESVSMASTQDGGFVVLAVDVANGYYVTKLDSAGNNAWTKTIGRDRGSPAVQMAQNSLATAPDGSVMAVGSYTDSLSYVALTKLNSEGISAGQWRIKFAGPSQLVTPIIRQILPVSDQGYLLVGQAAGRASTPGQGVAIQLDAQYNLIWQRVYPELSDIQEAVANSKAEGTYTAIGTGMDNKSRLITIAPAKTGDGNALALFPGLVSAVSLVNDVTGYLTVLDVSNNRNGDFRLTNGALLATLRWTKSIGGSGADGPTDLLATDDGGYLAVGTTTSTDGDIQGKSTSQVAAWVVKLGKSSQVTTLQLQRPIYDCQTGFIRFQTSGGDGSLITYVAPGITRAQLTDSFGTVESGLRQDPKVITIQATQTDQTVSYSFDLAAYCRTGGAASTDSLRLIAPTYNCQTGAITFHTAGGDGSPVEYSAPGITDWTSNPNQVVDTELRTAYDAQPITLMARQHGQVATYVLDIKAVCGRARLPADDTIPELSVSLLGNPTNETAHVQIEGAQGQSIQLQLVDAQGRLLEQRIIEQAGDDNTSIYENNRLVSYCCIRP